MKEDKQNKLNIEELKGLLDTPKDIPIEKLPPPKGISQEIIDAVKNPNADNKLYGYKDLAEEVQRMPEVPRITTGLSELDELLDGGLQPGEVMVLSATTKQGKTSFAQTMSYLQGLEGISNLWFTLEMSWQELTRKFMAMDTQLQGGGKISQLPIYYPIDNRGLSLEWMEKQIIKAKNTQDVKIVYIDHLHFLVPLAESKSNISFLVGGIIREIKQLSVRLEIPILLIAHTRKTDINTMPDINSPRDSSFIAQESDFTAILWREPIKQKKSRDVMDNSEIFSDKTVFSLVANRRNGKTKKIALGMWGGRFYPYLEYMARRSEAHMQDRNEDLEKVKDKVMSTEEKEVDKKAKQLFDFGS